jgi:hypothetical protein
MFASRALENEAVRDRRPCGGAGRIRRELQPREVGQRVDGLAASRRASVTG